MSNQFGFIDIILLAMFAGFIILRLRNILGRKTGHQGKPMSKYFPKKMEILKDINIRVKDLINNSDIYLCLTKLFAFVRIIFSFYYITKIIPVITNN